MHSENKEKTVLILIYTFSEFYEVFHHNQFCLIALNAPAPYQSNSCAISIKLLRHINQTATIVSSV